MSQPESWENICCRCGEDVKDNVHPGRRACHITCGPCLYPDNPKCSSCEIVGHCRLALDYFRSLEGNDIEKGHYFGEQLTGEETLYHTLAFTDGQQSLVDELGEKQYLKELKKADSSTQVPGVQFVPGLPRDSSLGWTRMTLMEPIQREWVEAISKVLSVTAKLEDNLHIVVRGEKGKVKKAVEMFYQLQMFFRFQSQSKKKPRKRSRKAPD